MIEPASFIGFAIASIATSWVASAGACFAVLVARRWLRRLGPRAERRAMAIALGVGPVVGLTVLAALAGHSLLGPLVGLADHCPHHDHHLHLCAFHGEAWAHESWAIASLALVFGLWALGAARRAMTLVQARAHLAYLARLGSPSTLPDGTPLVMVSSRRPFCFVAGLIHPRVFVSTSAWELLDDEQRRGMLAHEQAHLEQRDLWRRSLLGGAALIGAPVLVGAVLSRWRRATERLCDLVASRAAGPLAVAGALLEIGRAEAAHPEVACGTAFVEGGDALADRVDEVLREGRDGHGAARVLGIAAALACVLLLGSTFGLADPLHHALETLLGAF